MNFSNSRVLFRVDAGSQFGLSFGHLYRCLDIASVLDTAHSIESAFVMRNISEGVQAAQDNGMEVITLPQDISNEDEILSLQAIPGEVVIFDLIDVETRDMSALHQAGKKTLALDDFGNKLVGVQNLINGSIVKQTQNYNFPEQINQSQYFGPEYCVIGKRFEAAQRNSVSAEMNRILTTFGGSDPTDLTIKVVETLFNLPDEYEITVLVGPGYKSTNALTKTVNQSNCRNFQVKQNVPDILPEILKADLVITAGGRTVYEIAASGTPMILIPSIDHEELVATAIAELGAGVNLGLWGDSTKDILLAEIRTLSAENEREKMRLNELSIIDGFGLQRVCNLIIQLSNSREQP